MYSRFKSHFSIFKLVSFYSIFPRKSPKSPITKYNTVDAVDSRRYWYRLISIYVKDTFGRKQRVFFINLRAKQPGRTMSCKLNYTAQSYSSLSCLVFFLFYFSLFFSTLRLGSSESGFNVTVENNGKDPAYAVKLDFKLPSSLGLAQVYEINLETVRK